MKRMEVIDLGVAPYEDVYFLQKEVVRGIKANSNDDCLILAEHPGVFTIGRTGSRKNLLVEEERIKEIGLKIIDVDRGGDITFHGRGQLVAYPIFNLNRHARDIRVFLKNLTGALRLVLAEYGLAADSGAGHAGIWINKKKICFMGVGISNWITYHGVSINANVDLNYFSMIRPCGIEGLRVTSLQDILNKAIDIDFLKKTFLKKCCEVFGFEHVRRRRENAFMAEKRAS